MSESSPYTIFDRSAWAALRAEAPLTLTESEIEALRGIHSGLDLREVVEVYLPLSRLLNLYVAATQELSRASSTFLGRPAARVPFVIGVAGSVAVGKSTTSRILRALLARWPESPRVDLVTTDGFLRPNVELERRGLMGRKGFPESYDVARLLRFVSALKAGEARVSCPVYSHVSYDIVPGAEAVIERPDIVIVEGLNVLQYPRGGAQTPRVFVSDYFDFSIYVDASLEDLRAWYVDRFVALRDTSFRDPASYFHRYAGLSDEEAVELARSIWSSINEPNLVRNIEPTRERASLVLRKGRGHVVTEIGLRKV